MKDRLPVLSFELQDAFYRIAPRPKTEIYDECMRIAENIGFPLFMEFGVWKGGSINYLADRTTKAFYGFDSFEGLPEDWHLSETNMRAKGHFSTPIPHVRPNVQLFKGFFDESLPKAKETLKGDIALLHIDSDLYSSAKFVLTELNAQIRPGTIIIFDELCDWTADQRYYPKWAEGEWKALIEWAVENEREVEPIFRNFDMRGAVQVKK